MTTPMKHRACRHKRHAVNSVAFVLQAIGQLFILLTVARINHRIPPEGMRLEEPLEDHALISHLSNLGFLFVIAGLVVGAICLWREHQHANKVDETDY
jgi:hypothetical protein